MSKNLDLYHKDFVKSNIQYIILNHKLEVLESCDNIINFNLNEAIFNDYPFFLTLQDLVTKKENNSYLFSCIHFDSAGEKVICDVSLKTYSDKNPLLILQEFTSHYNNYQITSQQRNESVITLEKTALYNEFLKKQEAFKTKFIANFSHELREPLLGIIAFSEILKKSNLDYQQNSYLDVVFNSGTYLKQLIEDILDISSLRAKKLKLNEDYFNIKTLIEDLTNIYTEKAEAKQLKFTTVIEGKIPELINTDQVRLRQILTNVLKNAITYTSSGTIVFKISFNQVRAGKINTTFSVTDTGIGIDKEGLNDIFNSFAQLKLKNPNNDSKNFGLGLAITKELVNAFSGDINVSSILGEGTTFTINLNLKIDINGKKTLTQPKIATLKNNTKQIKVILLDDSEMVQMTLFKMMFGLKSFDLDIETNPDELVDRLETNDFDLVILDIDLKTHNGLDILKKIRKSKDKDVKNLPVIAMTANVLPKNLKQYKTAKIKTVLKKPFNEAELIEALNNEI